MTATIPETSTTRAGTKSSPKRPARKSNSKPRDPIGKISPEVSREILKDGSTRERASKATGVKADAKKSNDKKSGLNGSSKGHPRNGNSSKDIQILTCPSCNESVQPNWKRCPYCEASLHVPESTAIGPEVATTNATIATADVSESRVESATPTEAFEHAVETDRANGWAKFQQLPLITRIAFWGVGLPITLAIYLKNRGRLNGGVAVLLAVVGSLIYYPVLMAIGSDGQETAQVVPASRSGGSTRNEVPPPPPMPQTKLEIQASWAVVDQDSVELTGVSQQGANVRAEWATNSQEVPVADDGSFRLTIGGLAEGDTRVVLTGTASGHQTATSTVVITRQVSEQAYKRGASSVPYDQLNKDPAAMFGRVVTFKAKVFQYDSRTSTSHMMVEVTPGSYGFWDDLVFLNLDPQIAAEVDEDDVIQFWGSVKGAHTYDTAIGGSNTLPEIDVKYMKLIEKMDD